MKEKDEWRKEKYKLGREGMEQYIYVYLYIYIYMCGLICAYITYIKLKKIYK